ncbi:ATP-binding protein [Streptosporangium sp. NPDC051023]|uniref:ATP-binding protein n=1 Tax=Streptosporangium sp. NPDC051023 TaxID=3155410 RepID=UPI00344B016D
MTNAVLHSFRRGPDDLVRLTLIRRAGLFHVEALDPGGGFWDPHTLKAVPDDEEGGRGLAIVGEISGGRWGVSDHGRLGRTVWCAVGGGPDPAERS